MVYDQEAFVLEGEREHFGFRDDISQVGVSGVSNLPFLHFLTGATSLQWMIPGR